MIPKPILSILFVFLFLPFSFHAQEGSKDLVSFEYTTDTKEFVFPDIPGYVTLKCDFHMHTVFSDGVVWPTTRVDEAVSEGLDAIAITEHLEYWSHKNYVKGDHSTAYEIAKPYADKKDLILIRACEITKGMPPGHFNFLFIKDANAIDSVDWKKAIIQAREQGAYIMWNHPGWRMENNIPVWYEEHSWLMSEGLLDGIEVVNENEYYPEAWQWGIDSSLTIFGNSDIHDPVDLFYERGKGEHRPITLVFAKERSEEGIREALDNGRTAVYYKNKVFGDDEYLKELYHSSIEIKLDDPEVVRDSNAPGIFLANNSGVILILAMLIENTEEPIEYWIPPGKAVYILESELELNNKWMVKNFLVAPGEGLVLESIVP